MGMMDEALQLAGLGLAVFPLGERSKLPWAGSSGFHEATTDKATVVQWWTQQPGANIAVRPSGFVLDVDDRGPGTGPAQFAELVAQHGPIPETVTACSGRGEGRHYHFALPEGHPGVRGWVSPIEHLDVKTHSGGYVVAPPSIHPDTGHAYRWLEGCAPWERPIAVAPAWLLEMLRPVDSSGGRAVATRRDARVATPAERDAFSHEVSRLSQGATEAAGRLRRLVAGEPLFAEGGRNNGWRDLTQRLAHVAVGLELGDALEDLLAPLIEPSLDAEGRAAPGGVSLGQALDMAVRGLPRAEAERAQLRDLEECIYAAQRASGMAPGAATSAPVDSMDDATSRIEQLLGAGSVGEARVAIFRRAMAAPLSPASYPTGEVDEVMGYALRFVMTSGGWFMLAPPKAREAYACHPTPEVWRDGKLVPQPPFREYVLNTLRRAIRTDVTAGGKGKPESLVTIWAKHARVYTQVVFTEKNENPDHLNLFRGLHVTPREGDTSMWEHLLQYLSPDQDTAWLEKWLAWKLQHPFEAPGSMLLFQGGEGSGKSQLLAIYSRFFGIHSSTHPITKVIRDFNAHLTGQLLVRMEDIGELRREQIERLKELITADTLSLEAKFGETRPDLNQIGYMATSNPNALTQAEGLGRRWAIFEASPKRLPEKWYDQLKAWLQAGGRDAIAHRLLTMDVSQFNPQRVPVSEATKSNRVTALRGANAWLSDLAAGGLAPASGKQHVESQFATPESLEDGQEYSIREVMAVYTKWCQTHRSTPEHIGTVGKTLVRWGAARRATNGVTRYRLTQDALSAFLARVSEEGIRA